MRKMALFAAILVSFVFRGTVYADLDEGLAAHYRFDGNANDESGNGNNGTVVGASLTQDRDGSPNSAYSFDGVGDYINCGNGTSLALTTAMSIAVWINYAFQDGGGVILSKRGSSAGYEVFVSGDTLSLVTNGILRASTTLSGRDSDWIFVVFTWNQSADNPNLLVYVDGELETGVFLGEAIGTDEEHLFIGARYGSANFFHGIIDDVRIYSRALSESEIQALYGAVTLPVANAGPDQVVFSKVTLDGSGSSKAGGTIEVWTWTLVHRANPSFNRSASGAMPAVIDLAPGFYDVTLTVTDNAASTDDDTCVVAAAGPCGIDGDEKLGLAEVLYILQSLVGLHP